jgi:hypothetical protein
MNTDIPYHIVIDSIKDIPKDWIEILSSLLTPVIAILTFYIAYQQYKVNKNRFRLESYERKLKIYNAVQKFLNEILRDGTTDYISCSEYYSTTSESSFLLNRQIQDKIEDIYKKAIQMVQYHYLLYPRNGSSGLPTGEKRDEVVKRESELLIWLINQREIIKELFKKEISLKY